ncbi:MAG: hypothetical protein ABR510_14145, partial [Trueperaceae bacterium]
MAHQARVDLQLAAGRRVAGDDLGQQPVHLGDEVVEAPVAVAGRERGVGDRHGISVLDAKGHCQCQTVLQVR